MIWWLLLLYLLWRWNRWGRRYLSKHKHKHNHKPRVGVSRNARPRRKTYEQDRPYPECFDDNDAAWDDEMEEDL